MMTKQLSFILLACAAFFQAGCTCTNSPRFRPGTLAANVMRTSFSDPCSLGKHNYRFFLGETNGIVYTCRGGHVDLAHVRIAADNTWYLYHKFRRHLANRDPRFTFKLNSDRSVFYLDIEYPPAPVTDDTLDTASTELAKYCTWQMITWHELLTWFGFRSTGFVPEFESAFSWEDPYSNVIGVHLGAMALCEKISEFNSKMTSLIEQELTMLGCKSKRTALSAAESMRGQWYSGYVIPEIKLRSLDLGLDDGTISPAIVPGICPDAQPHDYPVPSLKKLESFGFKVTILVKPREWQSGKIKKIAGQKTFIDPTRDYPQLIDHMTKVSAKAGVNVMK